MYTKTMIQSLVIRFLLITLLQFINSDAFLFQTKVRQASERDCRYQVSTPIHVTPNDYTIKHFDDDYLYYYIGIIQQLVC